MKFGTILLAVAAVSAQPPSSASADLAADAQKKAAVEITNYDKNVDSDAKVAAKYSAMDAAAKTKYDAARKLVTDKRDARDKAERTAAGYDKMTLDQKTAFDAGLLKFKKTKYAACKDKATGAECTMADELRAAQEKSRNTKKYYALPSASAKADWDTKWKAEDTKLRATLTAAQKVKDDKIAATKKAEADKAKETGKSCAGTVKCATTHCCGTAKIKGKTTGELKNICNTKTLKTYKKGTQAYEFACVAGARALVVSASAVLAASYLM